MNTIQTIFRDHYEEIIYSMHLRQTKLNNITRLVECGVPDSGGTLYAKKRAVAMSLKLINYTHCHCVFTVPEELRHFFLENRNLLNCLFHAVSRVIFYMFNKLNKHENFSPGFILVLHTFGRDLKWNPRIHCLLSEGGSGNYTV